MTSPRFLIIKIGALGDLFFALPAISVLKAAYPESEITWLVGKNLATALKQYPQLDRIVEIDENRIFGTNRILAALEVIKTLLKLRRFYHTIFLLHRDTRYTLSFRFLVGRLFQLKRQSVSPFDFLAHVVRFPPLKVNESLQIQALVTAAFPETQKIEWKVSDQFWNPSTQSRKVTAGKYVVLHLGGGKNIKTEFTLKQWPYWSALIEKLNAEYGLTLLLVGAPGETELAQQVMTGLSLTSAAKVQNLVGHTTLPELISIILRAQLFVGVDSGPLHIADAAGVPSIGLFGPTSSISWGLALGAQSEALYHSVPCSPCYKDDGYFPPCPYQHRCMTGLTMEHVFLKIKPILEK